MANLTDMEIEQIIEELGNQQFNLEIEQILSPRLTGLTTEIAELIETGQNCRSTIAGIIIAKELGDNPGNGLDKLETDLQDTVEKLRKAHKQSVSIRQILNKYPVDAN